MNLLLLLLITQVSAEDIAVGISPSSIIEEHLLPGSHYEKEIILQKTTPANIHVSVEASGVDWVTIKEGNSITLQEDIFNPITIFIDVPEDALLKEYSSELLFIFKINEKTHVSLPLKVSFTVTNQPFSKIRITGTQVHAQKEDTFTTLAFTSNNLGNTNEEVMVELTVLDAKEQVITTKSETFFSPSFKSTPIHLEIPYLFPLGEYWAEITFYHTEKVENKILFIIEEEYSLDKKIQQKEKLFLPWIWEDYVFLSVAHLLQA